jgi:hypothetical protein
MGHINWETLQALKETHKGIHELLKRYDNEQDVTDEQLAEELRGVKDTLGGLITDWKSYLGHAE